MPADAFRSVRGGPVTGCSSDAFLNPSHRSERSEFLNQGAGHLLLTAILTHAVITPRWIVVAFRYCLEGGIPLYAPLRSVVPMLQLVCPQPFASSAFSFSLASRTGTLAGAFVVRLPGASPVLRIIVRTQYCVPRLIPVTPIIHSPNADSTGPRASALGALVMLAAELASGAGVDEHLRWAVDAVVEMLSADECSLWLSDGHLLHSAAATAGSTADSKAVELSLSTPNSGVDNGDGRSWWSAPLRLGPDALGALVVGVRQPLDAQSSLLLRTVADLLAPAIGHARRRQELEQEVARRVRQVDDERRFTERIIDSLPVGLYVIDRDYRIGVWNRKRETGLQGISRDEAVGRTIFEILHRQPAEMLREEFEDVFRTGVVQHFSMESNSTGDLRYYRISKIPMRDDGGDVTHIITIGEDVTESREAQERFAQAEKLAAIGQLAAGVMHEINNPLATIAACAESLTLTLSDARSNGVPAPVEAADYLRIVESEVQRCKRIVDRLLEFSRPKPLTPEPVDINAVVEQTIFLLKHHSRFKRYTVHVELADTPPVTRGNSEQLVQVLMALLINAMDATDEHLAGDPVAIDVTTRCISGPSSQAVIEVRDHGHGIPRSQLAKVFEPFYTTKAPGRGTGLGLSICYGIVAEHGGRIEVESLEEDGAIFRVLLPAGDAA